MPQHGGLFISLRRRCGSDLPPERAADCPGRSVRDEGDRSTTCVVPNMALPLASAAGGLRRVDRAGPRVRLADAVGDVVVALVVAPSLAPWSAHAAGRVVGRVGGRLMIRALDRLPEGVVAGQRGQHLGSTPGSACARPSPIVTLHGFVAVCRLFRPRHRVHLAA